jgi:hypothetical protein
MGRTATAQADDFHSDLGKESQSIILTSIAELEKFLLDPSRRIVFTFHPRAGLVAQLDRDVVLHAITLARKDIHSGYLTR